jgi:hypothetical protein
MNGHLSDEQLVGSALCESDKATLVHLDECSQCREEIRSLQGLIGAWVENIAGGAGTAEVFWRRQGEAIAARLARPTWPRPSKHLAWATATLALVLLATAVLYRSPAPAVNKATVDDNALLLSIHNSLTSDVPQALQPVTLLTQEIERAEEARSTRSD